MRTSILTIIIFLLAAPVHAERTRPKQPYIQTRSAIVMNLATENTLYEQNADIPIPPASLTKILSLYVIYEALENRELSFLDPVTVSRNSDRTGGSSMGLVQGETVTVWDLMKGMAVSSGNDACVAIAEHFPCGILDFVDRMNYVAEELGMTHSHFENPNGLPAKGQVTTARDMLTLAAAYIRRFPQALVLHTMPYFWRNKTRGRNRNKLLGRVEGVDGLKTGFVNASGYNLIVTAKREKTRLVGVVLGATRAKIRNREAEKLLETGFVLARFDKRTKPVEQKPQIIWKVYSTFPPNKPDNNSNKNTQ